MYRVSGLRSYTEQDSVYSDHVKRRGELWHDLLSTRTAHIVCLVLCWLLLIKTDIKWHALRMTPLISPVWVVRYQRCHSNNVFPFEVYFRTFLLPSAPFSDNPSGKSLNNLSRIFQLLLTLSESCCWLRGKSQGLFRKIKNHESVSHPGSKPRRAWVGRMARGRKHVPLLPGIVPERSGWSGSLWEQRLCGRVVCFWQRVIITWPKAEYERPRTLSKAKLPSEKCKINCRALYS